MFLVNVRIFPIFILLLISTMSSDTIEVRVLLRHYWKKGLSQRKAADEINEVEGEGTTSKSAAGRWFKRFDAGNFDLEDKPRSDRQNWMTVICKQNWTLSHLRALASWQQNLAFRIRLFGIIWSKWTLCTRSLDKTHMNFSQVPQNFFYNLLIYPQYNIPPNIIYGLKISFGQNIPKMGLLYPPI